MCNCIEEVNQKLKNHNTKLSVALTFQPSGQSLMIATEVIEKKRGARPAAMFPTFCPFCGERAEGAEFDSRSVASPSDPEEWQDKGDRELRSLAEELRAAWAEAHCCDDIKLDQPLANVIADLQAERDRLRKEVRALSALSEASASERSPKDGIDPIDQIVDFPAPPAAKGDEQ